MTITKPAMAMVPIPAGNKWNGTGRQKLAVVLHVAQCDTLQQLDNWFQSPANGQASSNYGIGPDGTIHCYVDPEGPDAPFANGLIANPDASVQRLQQAAGAGVNLNYVTVSIEHVGRSAYNELTRTGTPFVLQPAQLAASAALTAWLCERFGIPFDEEHLLGHYEIYSGHPGCPGFDRNGFLAYEAAVNAVLTPPAPVDPCEELRAELATEQAEVERLQGIITRVRNALP